MTRAFDEYAYLWPPRPEKAIPVGLLSFFERRNFVAQVKKNGTANVIAISPEGRLHCMNRHAGAHKAWQPTSRSSASFRHLPKGVWYVFVGELLHSKTPHIKDTNYLFDILVDRGEYLVQTTFEERQERLFGLFTTTDETSSHYVVDDALWLARVHPGGFRELYGSLSTQEDEGLVLKDPKARLRLCNRDGSNSDWQVKCRRGTKNFGF